jgi:hypothetical protein
MADIANKRFYVMNPDERSDDEDDYHHIRPQPMTSRITSPTTRTLPTPPIGPLRGPRYQPSHNSLSSPSSTSSPIADESTPPPSTPSLSATSSDVVTIHEVQADPPTPSSVPSHFLPPRPPLVPPFKPINGHPQRRHPPVRISPYLSFHCRLWILFSLFSLVPPITDRPLSTLHSSP